MSAASPPLDPRGMPEDRGPLTGAGLARTGGPFAHTRVRDPDLWGRFLHAALLATAFAIFAAPFAAFVLAVPRELLLALAGLALLNTFAGALKSAVADDSMRLAGIVTFLIGAGAITIFGVGGAFWALVAGVIVWLSYKPSALK